MNTVFPKPQLTPYEADYALWCAEQGALLRGGKFDQIDRENVAEEIESLGRSDKREIESRLEKLLIHLLKWRFQSEQRSGSWRSSIREQRRGIAKILKESPSLKGYPAAALTDEYVAARDEAADDTGMDVDLFPLEVPFSIADVLDPDFLPEP